MPKRKKSDAWEEARRAGIDVDELERNLALTPHERVLKHNRKLALLLAQEAAEKARVAAKRSPRRKSQPKSR